MWKKTGAVVCELSTTKIYWASRRVNVSGVCLSTPNTTKNIHVGINNYLFTINYVSSTTYFSTLRTRVRTNFPNGGCKSVSRSPFREATVYVITTNVSGVDEGL